MAEMNWKLEGEAVINDVKNHVQEVKLATDLNSSNRHIYLNLKTKESKSFCIELSPLGFRIVGYSYDTLSIDNEEWFETPYSLLNTISPLFNVSFGTSLLEKLEQLKDRE